MNLNKETQSQNRRAGERRGSILIFVVGILVLLALAATAYLSTARNDRVTSSQNEKNVQIDLLVEGICQAVIAKIMSDPSLPIGLASDAPNNTVFADASTADTDPWIASRVPILQNPDPAVLFNKLNLAANEPLWRFISSGIFSGNFEDPISGVSYANRGIAIPTVSNSLPALQFAADGADGNVPAVVASDADNDGVADSALIRVPVGLLDGIAYFAGIRIIDNNSKVNINTAFSRDVDYDGADVALGSVGINAAPTGMLTSSVGLRELLRSYDGTAGLSSGSNSELFNSINYRLGGAMPADVQVTATPGVQIYRSLGDELFHDVGRRTNNVRILGTENAYSASDELALSYRFSVRDPYASTTQTESSFTASVVTGVRTAPYAFTVTDIGNWFSELFDFGTENISNGTTFKPRRTLLAISNPQGMLVRGADMDGLISGTAGATAAPGSAATPATGAYRSVVRLKTDEPTPVSPAVLTGEQMRYYSPYVTSANLKAAAYSDLPYRCSVNTAGFPELWRGFWNAMCDPLNPSNLHAAHPAAMPPDPGSPQIGNKSVFNTTWTDRANWNDTNELLLRSGLAAVNVESLRSGGRNDVGGAQNDVIVRTIKMNIGATAAPTLYTINLFGFKRQPFITQAVLLTNAAKAAVFYAIELYNPYDYDISLNNWHLVALVPSATPPAGYTPTDLSDPTTTIPAATVIKAHGYLVLASDTALPGNITNAPSGPAVIKAISAAGLANVAQYNVMLVRPRRGDGTLSGDVFPATNGDDPSTPDTLEPNEGKAADPAPKLANLVPLDRVAPPSSALAAQKLYVHQRPDAAPTQWQFAYENVGNSWLMVQDPTFPVLLGAANNFPSAIPLEGAAPLAPNPWPKIQLGNANWPVNTLEPTATAGVGLNQDGTNNQMRFPFGGFSRLGELLEVPYMGSWTINTDAAITAGTTFIDSIPEPYDAFNCKFTTPNTTADCGRFFDSSTASMKPWATNLFEFFTVISHPWDDYIVDSPNVAPDDVPGELAAAIPYQSNYGLKRSSLGSAQTTVQGLININTAPQKVLASLPWMPPGSNMLTWNATTATMTAMPGPAGSNDNEKIASAIVAYRDYVNGGKHLEHISDLLSIPAVAVAAQALTATEPDDAQGDFTPLNPHVLVDPITLASTASNTDLVTGDFEEKSLMLTRVSNLITTRSDSFTVYIDLQGWKDAGKGVGVAKLVVERHAAMIVDRSQCSPSKTMPDLTKVPAN